jgi:hypothetical protein
LVNNASAGTVTPSIPLDEDGLYQTGITITASYNTGYSFGYWLVNGIKDTANPLTLSGHARIQAVFNRSVTVDSFTDAAGSATTPGTLRYALTTAQDGDIITITGVTAGTTTITLENALPRIIKSITLEGNGVTLTRAASWTSSNSSKLLNIDITAAEVSIRRVHFKNGLAEGHGAAIENSGILTLESCIFSGNRNTYGDGGAVYSDNTLTIHGCTFYGNSSDTGGAVYFLGKYLTLEGNLFYGNTASSHFPVVRAASETVSASYNVVDVAMGTTYTQAGFSETTGNTSIGTPFTDLPVSVKSFKLLSGSGAAAKLPDPLPEGYPTLDFYGNSISAGGAAGAVQASTINQSGWYHLEYSQNNVMAGTVTPSTTPDEDGLYQTGTSITASYYAGYNFGHWLVNGTKDTANPLTLSGHARIQAVFNRPVTVDSFTDAAGSATTPGTLRYALTNADDGDVITFDSVTAGTTTITLESVLPEITKSIALEGSGVTLTRAASWTSSYQSQLLRIDDAAAEVTIRRVLFKDGLGTGSSGGAILNYGILTLESCIFSGNRTTGSSRQGGAIYSIDNTLTIRGCTFYNNSSADYGGAVYFYAWEKPLTPLTLTLTGNLFYGNTAGNYPVVYNSGNYRGDGIVSASYNVVDVAFGKSSTQCGWTQGTGDIYITTGNPINTTTFAPKAGSPGMTEIGIVPAGLPDFPATDFYGTTRTFPNGAVGAATH